MVPPCLFTGGLYLWPRVKQKREVGWVIWMRSLALSSPALTYITPVWNVLTHITHTPPKIKSNAILEPGAHWELTAYYNGLKSAERTGNPVLHTLWSYVLGCQPKRIYACLTPILCLLGFTSGRFISYCPIYLPRSTKWLSFYTWSKRFFSPVFIFWYITSGSYSISNWFALSLVAFYTPVASGLCRRKFNMPIVTLNIVSSRNA
jgi:hypothetical protein